MGTSEATEPSLRLLGRRLLGANARFEVFLDDIEDDRGNRVRDFLSVLPKVADAGGVTGIALLPVRDGAFGMMRMARHPYGGNGWEIPMGFIDAGETPEQAAVREMQEETGLGADASRLVPLGGLSPAPSIVRARIRLFAAEATGAPMRGAAGEAGHGRFSWIPIADVVALADAGEIVEPCTLIAIYRYLLRAR